MSSNCDAYIVPNLVEDICNGESKLTECVIHSSAITYLQLPVNSNLTVVLAAYLASLIDARTRITALENTVQDFETRITALE